MPRFLLSLNCVFLICLANLICLRGVVPALAQAPTTSQAAPGTFVPHPVPPHLTASPAPVRVPLPPSTQLPTSGQVTALNQQIAVLGTQNAALGLQIILQNTQIAAQSARIVVSQAAAAASQAQVTAALVSASAAQAQRDALNTQVSALNVQLATLSPQPWGNYANPHTDGTHLVFAHYMVTLPIGGVGPGGAAAGGTTSGYLAAMRNDALHGVDGWALNAGDYVSPNYTNSTAHIFDAADQLTLEMGGKNNRHGVSHFWLFLNPDFSNPYLESPTGFAGIQNELALYANRPSYFHFQGKPFLSTYAGDGGGAAAVSSIYPPLLAGLKTAGLDPYFVPDFPSVPELAAVDAPGGFEFGPLYTPLGDNSPLPSQEALAAQVKASQTLAGTPRIFIQSMTMHWWNPSNPPGGRSYHEYDGGRGLAAQFDSAVNVVHPDEVEIKTENDTGDGTFFTSSAATTNWSGLFNYNVPGFWPTQDGAQTELDYEVQRYKTGQNPVIGTDTLIVSNRCQMAAASQSPTNDPLGPSYITNPSGWATGLQNVVSVTAYLTHSGFVRLSGVGPQQQQFAPAGVSHLTFYFTQAGAPLVELVQNGQVTKQVSGQPVSATAAAENLNPFSFTSKPGVKFVLSVPLPVPALPVDRAGLLVRATDPSFRCLGVQNFAAYDLTPATPALFAQNSINDPAGLGGKLSASTLAGADKLTEATGNAYTLLAADPLNAALPTLAYPLYFGNRNQVSWANAKPLPSAHVRVHCRVVKTSNDNDGIGGAAFMCSTGNTYFGRGYLAEISEYAGADTLVIKAEDNIEGDSNSAGAATLATMPVNTLALGEWYDIDFDDDGVNLTATATPSNQQN